MSNISEKEKVVRIPVVLFGQFDDEYLEEGISEEILQGQFIPIPNDTPIRPASYVELSRLGFNKTGVLVASILLLVFAVIEFVANGVLLAFNSNVLYVLGGCICAVFSTTAGAVGIAASCTLEDCPIGTTMIFATLSSLASAGQFGISMLGILVDFLQISTFGTTGVTNVVVVVAMHGFNGIAAIIGGVCSVVMAVRTCNTVCCTSRRFEYRELLKTIEKNKKPAVKFEKSVKMADNQQEDDSSEYLYRYREAWPTPQDVIAASDPNRPRKKDLLDLILSGAPRQKVAPISAKGN